MLLQRAMSTMAGGVIMIVRIEVFLNGQNFCIWTLILTNILYNGFLLVKMCYIVLLCTVCLAVCQHFGGLILLHVWRIEISRIITTSGPCTNKYEKSSES